MDKTVKSQAARAIVKEGGIRLEFRKIGKKVIPVNKERDVTVRRLERVKGVSESKRDYKLKNCKLQLIKENSRCRATSDMQFILHTK